MRCGKWIAISVFLVACAGPSRAPELADRPPPARRHETVEVLTTPPPARVPEVAVAWTPSGGELLAAMRVGTPEGDAALDEMSPEFAVSVLRAGLRLPPSLASYECARSMSWRQRDVAEHRMAVDHIVNAVVDPEIWTDSGSFWALLECFGSADIPRIHGALRGVHPTVLWDASDQLLHKVTHAEHLPLVASFLIENGFPNPANDDRIWLVCEFTDQHREAVARCLVGNAGLDAGPRSGPGLSPALRACLRYVSSEQPIYAGAMNRYRAWAERWLRDSVPGAGDTDLLLSLAADGWGTTLLWSLRHLDDDRTRNLLEERANLANEDPGEAEIVARAALACRGDSRARKSLRRLCTRDGVALGLLLEIEPAEAIAAVRRVLMDKASSAVDPEFEGSRLSECGGALWEAHTDTRLDYATTWDSSLFAFLEERFVKGGLPGRRLLGAAATIPALRTKRMVLEGLSRMGDSPPPDELFDDEWHGAEYEHWMLAEVTAPEEFRALLRRWSEDDRPTVAASVLQQLLRLGDPESSSALVAAARSGALSLDGSASLAHLALSGGPEVEAYLREVATSDAPTDVRMDAAAGLAVLHGLPASLLDQQRFWGADHAPDGAYQRFIDLALEGRGVDAYVSLLESSPDEPFWGAGDVDDPRVTAYLHRLRRERHLKAYAFATAELAIQGDGDALLEQREAIARGLYRWCDDDDARLATIGYDMGLVEHWAEFLEASDCQEPTARVTLDHLLDVSIDQGANHTPAAWFRNWRADHPGPFVWSRLGGHFVPAPR